MPANTLVTSAGEAIRITAWGQELDGGTNGFQVRIGSTVLMGAIPPASAYAKISAIFYYNSGSVITQMSTFTCGVAAGFSTRCQTQWQQPSVTLSSPQTITARWVSVASSLTNYLLVEKLDVV
jgi:hypothetical protein